MTHSEFNQLLSSIKALSPEQVRQLRQQLDRQLAQPKKPAVRRPQGAKRSKPAGPRRSRSPATSLIGNDGGGLITRLPDPALDIDDDDPDDQPVAIKGEPLSETIIRERR